MGTSSEYPWLGPALHPCAMRTLAGVDVGGTFTDVALVHEGRLTAVKLPTTIDDQSRAVIEGIERALEQAGLGPRELGHLGHGTTVATNALLERRGAVTGFVATRGFGDLLALARQTSPAPSWPSPRPPSARSARPSTPSTRRPGPSSSSTRR